jgi:hypothetical protein
LKLNKNEFPPFVSKLLRDYNKDGAEPEDIKINIWPVKTWYKATFQKGNRWNKALIRKRTMRYSVIELNQLVVAFRLIFNLDKKYNQTFIYTVTNIIEERTAEEEGLINPGIKCLKIVIPNCSIYSVILRPPVKLITATENWRRSYITPFHLKPNSGHPPF